MKRTLGIFIVIPFLIFGAIINAWASPEDTDSVRAAQDGVEAELQSGVSEEGVIATVKVKNNSEYAEQISVCMELPGTSGYTVQSDDISALEIPVGNEYIFSFLIMKDSAHAMAETEQNAADAWVTALIAIIVLAVATVVVILFWKKKKGRIFSFVLLTVGALLFSSYCCISAEETDRSFTLSDTIAIDGNAVEVVATVSYCYHFQKVEDVIDPGMDKFEITYYWGPQGEYILNEEYIKAIADCGFTSIPLENNTVENNKAALKLMEKYGLTCSALWDQRIYNVSYTDAELTQEEVDAVIAEVAADYHEFDNLRGYYIMDEPSANRFNNLSKVISAIRRLDGKHVGMINLFPNYASREQLASDSYEEYISDFITEVAPSYISYDHYHFMNDGTARKGFFDNLEVVRAAALKADLDAMQIILLTQHYDYANLTPMQLAWEVNMSLAYGMKRISYFTFWLDGSLMNSGWKNSCMNIVGKTYQHYYDVQEINQWLLPLGTELFDKESTAVFHLDKTAESQCALYDSYGVLGAVEGENAVIGFFDDDSFMFVNKLYAEGEESVRSYTLLEYSSGLEYFDTNSASWKSLDESTFAEKNVDGKYVITLSPGASALLRVQK